jgi:hypothetical protein
MPNVERFCTYRQSVDYVRRYCSFLPAAGKDAVLAATWRNCSDCIAEARGRRN